MAKKLELGLKGNEVEVTGKTTYNQAMIKAYDEFVEFIASGSTLESPLAPSEATKYFVAELIKKEQALGWEHFIQLEHIMKLAW